MVLRWANNNEEDCKEWMDELIKQKIRDYETLEQRLESSRWKSTFDKLSDGLAVKLERWHKAKLLRQSSSRKSNLFYQIIYFVMLIKIVYQEFMKGLLLISLNRNSLLKKIFTVNNLVLMAFLAIRNILLGKN